MTHPRPTVPLAAVVGLGLALRFLVMPWMAHPDSVMLPWTARPLLAGSADVYATLHAVHGDKTLTPIIWAPYMPLYYWIEAAWLAALDALRVLDPAAWHTPWQLPHLPRALLAVKAIYLPFELGTLWLLLTLVPEPRQLVVACSWLLSPIVVWVPYVMGQNDAIPTFFVVVALALGAKASSRPDGRYAREAVLAALSLGVGAAIKLAPLFLVPVVSVALGRRDRDRMALLVAGVAPVALVVLPFLSTPEFRHALFAGEGAETLKASFSVGGRGVSLFLSAWVALIAWLWTRRSVSLPVETTAAAAGAETPPTAVGAQSHTSEGSHIHRLDADAFVAAAGTVVVLELSLGYAAYNWLYWLMPFAVLAVARGTRVLPILSVVSVYFFLGASRLRGELGHFYFSPQFGYQAGFRNLIARVVEPAAVDTIGFTIFAVAMTAIVVTLWLRPTQDPLSRQLALAAFPLIGVLAVWPMLAMLAGEFLEGPRVALTTTGSGSLVGAMSSERPWLRGFLHDPRARDAVAGGMAVAPETRLRLTRGRHSLETVSRSGNGAVAFLFNALPDSLGEMTLELTGNRDAGPIHAAGAQVTPLYQADWREAAFDLEVAARADPAFVAFWMAAVAASLGVAATSLLRVGWLARIGAAGRARALATSPGVAATTPVRVGWLATIAAVSAGALAAAGLTVTVMPKPTPGPVPGLVALGVYMTASPGASSGVDPGVHRSEWSIPGRRIAVKVAWQGLGGPLPETVGVALIDAEGNAVSQSIRSLAVVTDAGLGATLSSRDWLPGQAGSVLYVLDVPAGASDAMRLVAFGGGGRAALPAGSVTVAELAGPDR